MEGYCLKCRSKREMSNTQAITMKNRRPATQGVCPVCSTRMFRIGKALLSGASRRPSPKAVGRGVAAISDGLRRRSNRLHELFTGPPTQITATLWVPHLPSNRTRALDIRKPERYSLPTAYCRWTHPPSGSGHGSCTE